MPGKAVVGGQAVIEGVMMRNAAKIAIAVRRPDRQIVLLWLNKMPMTERYPFLKAPLLRGIAAFIDSLLIGIEAITTSANEALEEEEEELTGKMLFFTVALSLLFGIGLFFLLPTLLVSPLKTFGLSGLYLNLAEGLIRVILFVGYLAGISLWSDVKRVFEYHGAEHKAVYCYEAGLPLEAEYAAQFTTLHPRCGTNFLFQVVFISIILFSFLGWPSPLVRIAARLALMPLIAGLAYEIIRFAGKSDFFLWRWFSIPGLWLQKLTTREPDNEQLEVALKALTAVIDEQEGEPVHVR